MSSHGKDDEATRNLHLHVPFGPANPVLPIEARNGGKTGISSDASLLRPTLEDGLPGGSLDSVVAGLGRLRHVRPWCLILDTLVAKKRHSSHPC